MRTTIDINEELINDVMKKAGVRTKKAAIVTALQDYLRHKKVEELKALVGNYETFDLTLDDLKKMRDVR
ncbi:MAG: type II toxin-antitoxin system VapB family antitoxin [Nitrospirae bacterium]|nr:MAG: type II toxin-antitoxin system VapB family antitoxin [Nitrospirota bacterium]